MEIVWLGLTDEFVQVLDFAGRNIKVYSDKEINKIYKKVTKFEIAATVIYPDESFNTFVINTDGLQIF